MLYYVRYTRGSLIISSIIFYINICISSCVFEILDERYIVSRFINGRRRWRLSVIFISRKREMKGIELALNSIDEILMFCLDVFRVGRRGPKFRFPIREGKKNYAA